MWEEALFKAAATGDAKTFQQAAERGARIDFENIMMQGNRPLHVAALGGHTEIVVWLLLNGANPNLTNRHYQNSPLHYAASGGHGMTVLCLLDGGADPNAADREGNTPLHWASQVEDGDCAKYLLQKGVDVTAENKRGETPLHYAAENGHKERVMAYCYHGADVGAKDHENGYTPFHYAAMMGEMDTMEILMHNDADIHALSSTGQNALHRASWNGKYDAVEFLLHLGVDPNVQDIRGDTPLHDAVIRGNNHIVTLLLKNGADRLIKNFGEPPHGGSNPYQIAQYRKLKQVCESFHRVAVHKTGVWSKKLKFLRNRKKTIKLDWDKVFLEALERGDMSIIKTMRERGVKVNRHVESYFCWTPLHYAVAYGHLELAMYLVDDWGADINALEEAGEHVLHLAAFGGHFNIVKWLISEKGIPVNWLTDDKRTACHCAALGNNYELICFLVANGADINVATEHPKGMTSAEKEAMLSVFSKKTRKERAHDFIPLDEYGRTVLHVAAEKNYLNLCHRLVQWGAEINTKDHHGNTALHFAAQAGHSALARRLLGLGADPLLYNRRGKSPEFLAHENLRLETIPMMKKNIAKVHSILSHKSIDSFFLSLKVAGLSEYFGIFELEGDCKDMRVLCDKVIMTRKRLKRMGLWPVEIKRIARMGKSGNLGRSLKLDLVENDLLSVYKVLGMHGYRFSFDLVEIGKDVFNQMAEKDALKLKGLQTKVKEEFHINDNKDKHSIENFWASAQVDSSLTELGDAIREMEEMEQIRHDFSPVRPEAPGPRVTQQNVSPRQERFRVAQQNTRFLAAKDINVKDMLHLHDDISFRKVDLDTKIETLPSSASTK